MKFIVQRSSDILNLNGSPCEEAFIDYVIIENISREKKKIEVWCIEINFIEQLIAFRNKYGGIIISKIYDEYDYIEIYDDYVES